MSAATPGEIAEHRATTRQRTEARSLTTLELRAELQQLQKGILEDPPEGVDLQIRQAEIAELGDMLQERMREPQAPAELLAQLKRDDPGSPSPAALPEPQWVIDRRQAEVLKAEAETLRRLSEVALTDEDRDQMLAAADAKSARARVLQSDKAAPTQISPPGAIVPADNNAELIALGEQIADALQASRDIE